MTPSLATPCFWHRQALPQHTHVVFEFQQGGDMRFVDPRTFGEMFVASSNDLGKVKELDHIAIDPLEDTFTWQEFSYELGRRASKLKPLLMDQKFISGLGNICAIEILYRNDKAQAQIVDDILDMSRLIAGKLRIETVTVDLSKVIDKAIDSVHLAAHAKHAGPATV